MMSHSLDIKGNNIIHDFDPFISFYNPENDHTLSNNYFLTRKHHMKLSLRIVKFNEHLVQNDTHITGWSGIKFFLEFNTSLFKHRRTIHRKKPLTTFGRRKPSIFFFSHNLYYLSSRFMRYRNLLVKVRKTYYHNITFFRQVRPLNRYLFFHLFLKLHHFSFRLPLWIKAIYKKRYIFFLYYIGFRISVYKRALIKPLDGPKPWKAFFYDPFKIRNLMHRNHKRKHRARQRVRLLNHYLSKRKRNWKTTYHLKRYTPEFRAQTKLIIQAFKSNHGNKRLFLLDMLSRTVSYRLVNYRKRLGKKNGFFMRLRRLRRLLRNYLRAFPKLQYHRRINRNQHLVPMKLRSLKKQEAILVKKHRYTNGVISLKPSLLRFNPKIKRFKRYFSHFKRKKRIPRWLKPKRYIKRRTVPKVYYPSYRIVYLRRRMFIKQSFRMTKMRRKLRLVLVDHRLFRHYCRFIKSIRKKPKMLNYYLRKRVLRQRRYLRANYRRVRRVFHGYNKRLNKRLMRKQIVIIKNPLRAAKKASKKIFIRYKPWIARWKLMNKLVRFFYTEQIINPILKQ